MAIKKIIYLLLIIIVASCTLNSPETDEDENDITNKKLPTSPKMDYDYWGSLKLYWKSDYETYKVVLKNASDVNDSLVILPPPESRFVIVSGLKLDKTYKWTVYVKNIAQILVGPTWEVIYRPVEFKEVGYIFRPMGTLTKAPFVVNTYFQLLNIRGKGNTTAMPTDFLVKENGVVLPYEEAVVNIKKHIPEHYVHRVILALDNSTSEKGNSLTTIKSAADLLIDKLFANVTVNKEVMLVKFSDKMEIVLNYSSNPVAIKNAIHSIDIEWATTNLYGTIIEATKRMNDILEYDFVEQYSLVMLTDGTETQNSSTLPDAVRALIDKNMIAVGIGEYVDDFALETLAHYNYIKNDGKNLQELNLKYDEIIENFFSLVNSIYHFRYYSPKRENVEHILNVAFKNNTYFGSASVLNSKYNSKDFFSAKQGIYVNANAIYPSGIDTIFVKPSTLTQFTIDDFLLPNKPNYYIDYDNSALNLIDVRKVQNKENVYELITANVTLLTGIVIKDWNNPGFQKRLIIKIGV